MDQKELRDQENRCIQEHAPACTATCPAHVDVRGMVVELGKGDFSAAFRLYRKVIPFPGIISHICDQPCRIACLRKGLGGAIEIAALERACLDYGSQDAEGIKPLPRKAKTVAIIGAGLKGLTVAYDLARKGWGVVIYESGEYIGGRLRLLSPNLLPHDVLANDLKTIDGLGVETRLNTMVDLDGRSNKSISLSHLCEAYDAVYLGIFPSPQLALNLKLDENGQIAIDPLTFQTSHEKLFTGRNTNFSKTDLKSSFILSIANGHRAGTSIDRYLQKVSLSAARSNEGPYETLLYTNTTGIPSLASPIITDLTTHYDRETAESEAKRCIQCECMECVKACEYLKQYKGYPKKYIREVYNNLSIVMGTRHSNRFINSCALCGLCGEICPTDVDMGEICHNAREQMVEQKRMPASAHDFALQDMAFSNSENFSLARNAPGANSSSYVFFPGCQLSASAPDYVENAYAFLRNTFQSTGVGLMLRCCGAPADWAGRKDLFATSQVEFQAEYNKIGRPKVILACSSCYRIFQKYYPDVEILSLWDLYDQFGPQKLPHKSAAPVAIHDPCSTRYESHIQDSVRSILNKMDYEVHELPLNREKTECCSYGGLVWLANRPLSEKIIERRIAESPLVYVTYCAMCRDFFVRRGKPTLHILDLIFAPEQPELARQPGPGYSQRHENRARLKTKLLKELWSENMPEPQGFHLIRLVLPETVQRQIDERLILVEDIQKVIEYAERTGKRLFNSASGHSLASYRPTSVTYWVEYSLQDGAYRIHKAYSHRMEIGLGGQK